MEYLHRHVAGQFADAVSGVVQLAGEKGLFQIVRGPYIVGGQDYRDFLPQNDRANVVELIRQLFWDLLIKGVIVLGTDERNGEFPFYRVTAIGQEILNGQPVQPYDPDKFISFFRSKVRNPDPVILEYVDEATRALNSNCIKSCFVMIGCSSEKAILLLHETFELAISVSAKKVSYQKSYNWTISSKFKTLKDHLDLMVAAGKFPNNSFKDLIAFALPGAYELIRRLRNSNGHPELYTSANPDEAFLTLRILPEYISNIYTLIEYFQNNPADW